MLSTFPLEIFAALRSLRRAPGFSLLAIALLAAGIGANVALFSVFNSIVLSPLPYAEPQRLVGFNSVNAPKALTQPALSAADFRDLRERAQSYAALAAFRPEFVGYAPSGGEPVQLIGGLVTEEFFTVFGTPALRGRTFRTDEFAAAAPRTAVISAAGWRRHFGGRDEVIGATITIERQPTMIIGVMPEHFREPEFADIWLPFAPESGENLARDSRFWTTVGRLAPNASSASAQAEAGTIAAALAEEYPAINKGWTFSLQPLLEQRVGGLKRSLLLLNGAVALVLIVACVNLANLLVARGLVRMPELAVRLALGASPRALARGVLWESVLLSLAGGAAGIAFAATALPLIASRMPAGLIPRSHAIALDGSALAFAVTLSVCTGVFFGLLPAWQVRRADVNELLKSAGARGTPGRFTGHLQGGLIAAQVALTLIVLTGAALLAQSLLRLQHTATGFEPRGLVAVRVAAGQQRWITNPNDVAAYYDRLAAELARTTGVTSVAFDSSAPLGGISLRYPFWVQGRPRTEGNADEAVFHSVSPDFAATLKLPLRSGRCLETRDDFKAPRVCVINEALARRIFPGENPLGKRIQTVPWLARDYREVVGVIADAKQDNLADPAPPQIYVPSAQSPWFFTTLLVRVSPGTGAATLQAALRRVDPGLTMTVRSVEENIALTTMQPRLRAWLFAVFGAAALALSAFGIYASMAFTVSQRTREIGVRMALGASPQMVLRSVLARAAIISALGVVAGLAGALALAQALRGFVPDLEAAQPAVLAALAVFLPLVALLATLAPAWRAARLNPTRALQQT